MQHHHSLNRTSKQLYEKAKKMPAVVAAKRNIADTSGQVVGVRYGRFTICRVWYDCGSELWALEVKHDEGRRPVDTAVRVEQCRQRLDTVAGDTDLIRDAGIVDIGIAGMVVQELVTGQKLF